MNKLKSEEFYHDKISKLTEQQIEKVTDYNKLNMYRLHLDERDVLQKNLNYLTKARQNNLNKFN